MDCEVARRILLYPSPVFIIITIFVSTPHSAKLSNGTRQPNELRTTCLFAPSLLSSPFLQIVLSREQRATDNHFAMKWTLLGELIARVCPYCYYYYRVSGNFNNCDCYHLCSVWLFHSHRVARVNIFESLFNGARNRSSSEVGNVIEQEKVRGLSGTGGPAWLAAPELYRLCTVLAICNVVSRNSVGEGEAVKGAATDWFT